MTAKRAPPIHGHSLNYHQCSVTPCAIALVSCSERGSSKSRAFEKRSNRSAFTHQPQAQMGRRLTHRAGAAGGVAFEVGQSRRVASGSHANAAELAVGA